MPKVHFNHDTIECEAGANLRDVLLEAGQTPHNGNARWFNCKGMGTCGTCALKIQGEVTPMGAREKWRLSFPPHTSGAGLRLACQCKVLGDLSLEKCPGFWGQDAEAAPPCEVSAP